MTEYAPEQRVLIAAPSGGDGAVLSSLLDKAGIATAVCASLEDVCQCMETAALAILAEEVLTPNAQRGLAEALSRQPEWSDFPLIVVAAASDRRPYGWHWLNLVQSGAHALVLQRPVRKITLLSAVRAALQSRARQYQVRDELARRQQVEEKLREAHQRKDEFLATLAHELRNPLAPIRNATAIFKLQDSLNPALQTARDIIDRQVQHMVRLIDDLLDVSRITRGKLSLRKERVELAKVLESALEASRPHLESAGHDLRVSLPARSLYLDADPVRLAQVFLNLINNACKYTEPGGRIRLSAVRDGTGVAIKIADTGIGIAPAHLPRLFEMFSQVGSTLERASSGGLGIGLALARGLVELHSGRITAHSEGPGQGSEFTVWLPVPAQTPATPPHPPDDRDRSEGVTARRILVVDDNPATVESLALLLRLKGNAVETASDGLEALAAAECHRPEIVLLDIGMPRLDGYGACRRLRGQPWGKDITIIALTGWGQEDDRRQTQEAGFDAHLVKPVDPAALWQLLAQLRAGKDAAAAADADADADADAVHPPLR